MERYGGKSQITRTQKKNKFQTSVRSPKMMMSIISAINKDDIHYEEKKDGDVKEYTDEDEDEGDEEGYSDCGILF